METKEKIICAMTRLFSEKGYITSMSEVAKEVGIKVPSIYSHFESKDQIISLAVEKELESFHKYLISLKSNMENETTEEILEKIYFGIIGYYEDYKRLKINRNIDLIPDGLLYKKCNFLQKEYMKKYIRELSYIFERGYERKELKFGIDEGYHYLYLTMIQGILNGMITFDEESELRKKYQKKVWKTFWNAIKS